MGLRLTLEAEAKRLRGDPDLLRVVMDNLIGNAIKYGREGSIVRISTRQADDGLRVEVYNEGIGVAPDKIGNLFQKFYRVHDPKTKLTKGTGVGLYLVRWFVELQGGVVGSGKRVRGVDQILVPDPIRCGGGRGLISTPLAR